MSSFLIRPGAIFSGTIDYDALEVRMSKDSLIRVEGNGLGVKIHCTGGVLWITQENDLKDYFISAGKAMVVNRLGLVMICAYEDAQMRICLNNFQQALEMALNQTYSEGGCWKLKGRE